MNSDVQNYDTTVISIEHLNNLYGVFKERLPDDISVSGLNRAVLEGDYYKVKRWIELGGCVNEREEAHGFSALHLAVIKNDIKILEYLLSRVDIQVDARCSEGRTPLYLASALGWIDLIKKLIHAGSDVNIPTYERCTPLHVSVHDPNICHLLIRHGAAINAVDYRGRTPLHHAAEFGCLETIHMLLYYNADVNFVDKHGFCCFMAALAFQRVNAQEVLLEYVDDFNRTSHKDMWYGSILTHALHFRSPFVKDIIERGADVNGKYDITSPYRSHPFEDWLRMYPADLSTFKLIWERLRYNHIENNINLLEFLHFPQKVMMCLPVIIESDNFEPVVDYFSSREKYYFFVDHFAERKYDLDQLTALTCRLLQYGFCPTSCDVDVIFSRYGYCELFRILLYMDIDFSQGKLPHMPSCWLIFGIDYDSESVVNEVDHITRESALQLLEYSVCSRLIEALTIKYSDNECMNAILGSMPRVPSLIELTRNAARKQIWQSFKITNTCQFYTTIDHLNIAAVYKDILTFKRKIYNVK